jgi:LemA protein
VLWWTVGLSVAAILGYVVWTYNRLIGLNKRADAAWSDIDVQLKRRWDLVPSLVETVGCSRANATDFGRIPVFLELDLA